MKNNKVISNKIAEIKISYSHQVNPKERIQITSSRDVYDAIVGEWPDIDYRESFAVLYLNRSNRLLGINWISKGGCAGTVVDIKIILQGALKANSSAIIGVHNHPSANLEPSQEDKKITAKIREACKVIDISFLDHLIISSFDYHSMADEGEL